MLNYSLLFTLLCILSLSETKSLRILNDTLSIADVDFRTYKIPNDAENWELTGRLVVADPFDACHEIKNGNELIGNIALVAKYTCTIRHKVENLKKFNVSGIMVFNQQTVAEYAFEPGHSKDDKLCEVFSVKMKDTAKLKKTAQDEVLIVQVTPGQSPWWELDKDGALVFFTIFFVGVQLTGIGLSLFKLHRFWSVRKYRWSVPTNSLMLLICAFVVQIPIHLDPQGTRGMFAPKVRANIFTMSFPFVMSVSLLISFYWQAAISAVYRSQFLPTKRKFLIPIGVLCFVFVLLECIRIGFGVANTSASQLIFAIIFFLYLVVIEVVSLFYIVSASRVLLFLQRTQRTKKTMKAKRLTFWLLLSAVCYFIMPFFFGVAFVPPSPEKGSLFALLFIADGLYHLVQFSLVMAFQAPRREGEQTTMDRTSSAERPTSTRNEDMQTIELS